MTEDGDLEDGDVLRVRGMSASTESIFEVKLYICPEYDDVGFDPVVTPDRYCDWHLDYKEWVGCTINERLI